MKPTRNISREKAILALLFQGWSLTKIARHFGITPVRVAYIRDRALAEQTNESPFFTVREG